MSLETPTTIDLHFHEDHTPTAEIRLPLERRAFLIRRLGFVSAARYRAEALYARLIGDRIANKRAVSAERLGAASTLLCRTNTVYCETIALIIANHQELAEQGVDSNEYAYLFQPPGVAHPLFFEDDATSS